MTKRSEKPKQSELPIFTERFRSLFLQDESQAAFGNRAGLSRNTVAQYYNGYRIPDSVQLQKICKSLNVSADWFLGFSDVKIPDADLQSVVKFTGFSEKAIENLKVFNDNSQSDKTGLDILLRNWDAFCSFVNYVNDYMNVHEAEKRFEGEKPPFPFKTENNCIVLPPDDAARYYANCIGETIKQVFLDLI